jgi:hypothetical protein
MKIITRYVMPPIPSRYNDWVAYVDGQEEGPFGWGETEQEALRELEELLGDNDFGAEPSSNDGGVLLSSPPLRATLFQDNGR